MFKHLHGGNLERAMEKYGISSEKIIDFSANINPLGFSSKIKEAITKNLNQLSHYPDPESREAKKEISGYFKIDYENIILGNGSTELIYLIVQTLKPKKALVTIPTFCEYERALSNNNIPIEFYQSEEELEFSISINKIISQLEGIDLVFLCNPNNPTGRRLELSGIEQILNKVSGIVLVDEAYYEFSGLTAAGLLSRYDNLIILRTFSKALGLAGLRVGYMLACPSVVSYIDRVRSPFNVNAFAQAAAVEVLENIDTVTERIEIIKSERKRLTELLTEFESLQCFESWSNFILVRSPYAGEIYKRLQAAGIYIKSFSEPILKDCLRVTIGSRLENDRFYEIVKEVLYEGA